MKKMKKLLAFALAMVMTLAMSVTVFAAQTETHKPTADDKATITVNGVESGATVTAYQFVEGNYNDKGLVGYQLVAGLTSNDVADIYNPTLGEAIALTDKKLAATQLTEQNGAYVAEVHAGTYLILVTDVEEKVYNPMVVSVSYNVEGSGSNNTLVPGSVTAADKWTLSNGEAVAKSSTPSVDKVIVGEPDVAVGDSVSFSITTTIPEYSADYKTVTFKLTDTLSAGLTYNEDGAVTVGGKNVEGVAVVANGQVLTIDLSAIALAHTGEEVVVTYTATLNENAVVNYDANTNKVELEYSNDPDDDESKGKTDDETYTYTFKIEDLITKTDSATDKALAGAVFTLTNNATGKVYTGTSADDGDVSFTGLDAGEYTLVETQAPTGYSLDATERTVVITPTYQENGKIDTITITIDGKDKVEIPNTTLSALPATGGIGTMIFTIVGCVIMVVSAGLFFAVRRKSN